MADIRIDADPCAPVVVHECSVCHDRRDIARSCADLTLEVDLAFAISEGLLLSVPGDEKEPELDTVQEVTARRRKEP